MPFQHLKTRYIQDSHSTLCPEYTVSVKVGMAIANESCSVRENNLQPRARTLARMLASTVNEVTVYIEYTLQLALFGHQLGVGFSKLC